MAFSPHFRVEMATLFASLLRLFLQIFRSRRTIVAEITLVRKENEILLRRLGWMSVEAGFLLSL
jgi:hypothetical protein